MREADHVREWLSANLNVCAPAPKLIVELVVETVNVPIWSLYPVDKPELRVPPLSVTLLLDEIALATPISNVPALTVVMPEYVFTPASVHLPTSIFVSEPVVVPRILESLPPCAPPNVSP